MGWGRFLVAAMERFGKIRFGSPLPPDGVPKGVVMVELLEKQ